jgi:hypothetical protein
MRSKMLTRLTLILLTLFGVTATFSQETQPTPTMPSAVVTQPTAAAVSGVCVTLAECNEKLAVANQRLLKVLADLDASIASGQAKDELIQARRLLTDLLKEGMAIKDQFIADLKADNEFLRKTKIPKAKSTVRKIFDGVVKFLVFVAGVKVGQGL